MPKKRKTPAKSTQKQIVEVQIKAPPPKKRRRRRRSRTITKTRVKEIIKEKPSKEFNDLTKQLNGNLVSLQKVHINLAEKFGKLSTQIAALLSLFETAAKKFAESPTIQDKELAKKIDELLEINRTIAKSMALMGEKEAEAPLQPEPAPAQPTPVPQPAETVIEFKPPAGGRPLPRF